MTDGAAPPHVDTTQLLNVISVRQKAGSTATNPPPRRHLDVCFAAVTSIRPAPTNGCALRGDCRIKPRASRSRWRAWLRRSSDAARCGCRGLLGPGGGELVAVELEEVVARVY